MKTRARVCFDIPLPEERVFRYQAMQDILHHLTNNPFESFSQEELANITGADVSSVSRSIDLLDKLGVLAIEEGVPAQISVDQDHLERPEPLFAVPQTEFRQPIQAFLEEFRADVESASEVADIVGIVLFGSVARGTADRSSDIDLFIVVEGDGTYGRRIATQTARQLEEQSFDGDRYQFEVLVETPESARSHGDKLQEIVDEGVILAQNERFRDVRDAIYQSESGDA